MSSSLEKSNLPNVYGCVYKEHFSKQPLWFEFTLQLDKIVKKNYVKIDVKLHCVTRNKLSEISNMLMRLTNIYFAFLQ